MDHLTDKQLLEMLERSQACSDELQKHLDHCDSCQECWLALRNPWDALGEWAIEGQDQHVDLTDRILEQVEDRNSIFLWQSRAWLRIAATIIIGIGLGTLLGRSGPAPVTAEEVSEAIYLDALSLTSSTGWTTPMLNTTEEFDHDS